MQLREFPPTHDQRYIRFNGKRGGEPRGVWLRTLPVGSGYQHKHSFYTYKIEYFCSLSKPDDALGGAKRVACLLNHMHYLSAL